jgi:type VI protein secretion system component Hcp
MKKAYLHIPGITGTGTKLHRGWIEVIQFSYSVPIEGSKPGHAIHHHPDELRVSKEIDGASQPLRILLMNNGVIPEAKLEITLEGATDTIRHRMTFKNGKVMAIRVWTPDEFGTSQHRTQDTPEIEHVTFRFETMVSG